MNNKLLVVILLICALIIVGLASRDGDLLILSIPLLVYLFIGFVQAPGEVNLVGTRKLDKPGMRAGEIAEVQIEIENRGDTLHNFYVRDRLAPSMTKVSGQADNRLTLQAGKTIKISYQFSSSRGVYHWDSIETCAADPFRLFEKNLAVPADGRLLVYPQPLQAQSIQLRTKHTLHAAGPMPARSADSGIDFWGIREYRPGDSLHHLNWRLAARSTTGSRKIFTNEYQREEIADYGLILDARKFSTHSNVEEELFECSVSAAAAISESLLSDGNRLSLLIFGDKVRSLFPGYGKHQINKVQSMLARASIGENFPFSYLEYLPTRLFPSRSTIMIISPVHNRDYDVYARLISFGYDVFLIAPDLVDFASEMNSTEHAHLALRAAAVERVAFLKRLLQLGVKVVDWKVNQPFDAAIRQTAVNVNVVRNI